MLIFCIVENLAILAGAAKGLIYADEHGYLDWANPTKW